MKTNWRAGNVLVASGKKMASDTDKVASDNSYKSPSHSRKFSMELRAANRFRKRLNACFGGL